MLYGVVAGRGGTGHPGAGGGFRCPLHIGGDKGWGTFLFDGGGFDNLDADLGWK